MSILLSCGSQTNCLKFVVNTRLFTHTKKTTLAETWIIKPHVFSIYSSNPVDNISLWKINYSSMTLPFVGSFWLFFTRSRFFCSNQSSQLVLGFFILFLFAEHVQTDMLVTRKLKRTTAIASDLNLVGLIFLFWILQKICSIFANLQIKFVYLSEQSQIKKQPNDETSVCIWFLCLKSYKLSND